MLHGRAVAADDVDLMVGMTQLHEQIVEQIEFLDVVILHVIGAMVAQEVVELRDRVGKVFIADAIDHIDALAGVQVVEAQAVLLGLPSIRSRYSPGLSTRQRAMKVQPVRQSKSA